MCISVILFNVAIVITYAWVFTNIYNFRVYNDYKLIKTVIVG